MSVTTWPQQDQAWIERYRRAMTGKHVPAAALEERERELLEAVRAAGAPAAELFGDATDLAAEDLVELATVEEEVRTSPGGGVRPALTEVGRELVGLGTVSVLLALIRNGWSVHVYLEYALVAASVAVPYLGWVVCRVLLSGGRPAATSGVLASALALAVAGITAVVMIDSEFVLARDVPVPLLGLIVIGPGVLALVAAGRLPQPTLREDWDDADWLRRLRGGLRSRLVPAATARGHVEEVQQAIRTGSGSAFEEFGHPLVLARTLAEADRTSRVRRWWVSVVVGSGSPSALAALVHTNDSWGALTTPIVVVLVLVAVLNLLVAIDRRPRRTQP